MVPKHCSAPSLGGWRISSPLSRQCLLRPFTMCINSRDAIRQRTHRTLVLLILCVKHLSRCSRLTSFVVCQYTSLMKDFECGCILSNCVVLQPPRGGKLRSLPTRLHDHKLSLVCFGAVVRIDNLTRWNRWWKEGGWAGWDGLQVFFDMWFVDSWLRFARLYLN